MRFLHNSPEHGAGEGVKKNIKYCGTEIARVGNADFFVFSFLFSREKENIPHFASPSRVNRRKRCSRAGRNCEEIGLQTPFILDCLKIVLRAAFWGQLSYSEGGRAEMCVGRSCVWDSWGWDGTQVAIASGCSQAWGRQGEAGHMEERLQKALHPVGATSPSATGEVSVGP